MLDPARWVMAVSRYRRSGAHLQHRVKHRLNGINESAVAQVSTVAILAVAPLAHRLRLLRRHH